VIGLILDLAKQVRGILRPGFGGTGNAYGWAAGKVIGCSNRTGGDLPLMTLVRAVTAGGPRVEPTDTDAETDVLGVVVGYFDEEGLLIEADSPDGSTVAVLTDGLCNVLTAADVLRGEYAFASVTAGQAYSDPTLAAGAFGQFTAGGGAGLYAQVRLSLGGGGSGATIGTPAVTLSTTNAAGSGPDVLAVDATIAVFDATVPVTQAFGDSAATGSAGKAARRDHKHGMPAAPAGGTPALTLSTTNAAGAAATFVKTDATIVAFDATVPTTSAPGDAAATGSAAVAARRDHLHGREAAAVYIGAACSNETSPVTTGSKVTLRAPAAFTVTAVRASLKTAQASGSIFTVDILKNGSSILSTLITIDNTEKTSTTAVTPPVISASAVADDDELSVSVTQIGDGTAIGLKAEIIGTKP
jgi:hypothetical protein